MATLGTFNPTYIDLQKRLDPNGDIAPVAELLYEYNEVIEDMTWMEGNLPTGHRSTIRTGIPEPAFRKFYGFTQPSKSTTVQVTDNCGMLDDYSVVDKAMADLNNNAASFRLSEDLALIQGFRNKCAESIFYGDETITPEGITGLAPRYNDLSAENADNIIDAGGTGVDNASIWLVCWSPMTVHGIVPKGSAAGLQMKDLGEVTVQDTEGGTNGLMQAYRTYYRWDIGLTVRDWRAVVRIANIDKSELTADASSGANLPQLMFEASELLHEMAGGRCTWYMSRDVKTKLGQQIASGVENSTLEMMDVGGRKVMAVRGWPVRRVDALAADEARVV